ncbi:hypothetical protein ACFXJ6_07750 [Streptomyces sp. NPDC059218]|uniref:hypothetical protein n=1 Tax=unclassified Streptomyces TaxID=2593676 RepID=UPI0036C6F3FD
MLLRQITTCTDPATTTITRHGPTGDRSVLYRVGVCRRHQWLAQDWHGQRTRTPAGQGRCGTVIDYRDHDQVMESHLTVWLGPTTTQYPQMHGGSLARTLRAAAGWVNGHEDSLAGVLGHAAAVAEAVEAGALDAEPGRAQLLAALSVAETIGAAARGA